jgi:hypothetical protein
LPPKADICQRIEHVRYVPIADMQILSRRSPTGASVYQIPVEFEGRLA